MLGGQRRRRRLTLAILAAALVAIAAVAYGAGPLDDLAAEDPKTVTAAVAAIEHGPGDADALFAAARACEDRLHDPARAAALYERILRDLPDARVALLAERRAEQLRAELGPGNEYAREAGELARLVADADTLDPLDVLARGDLLADKPWPGAADAELWLAEWERSRGRYPGAQKRYAELARRWPGSPQALEGARHAAGCALDAHDWALAEKLATQLPGGNPIDDAARTELVASAHRGAHRDALATGAELVLALACFVLLASLADAVRRGGVRWPSPRPPLEAMFLAPIAGLLVAVAWLAERTIAPAVTRISIAGVALAWLSGTTLDLLRARGRSARARSLVHILACALGVVACAYLAIESDGLLDMLAETARYGPEP